MIFIRSITGENAQTEQRCAVNQNGSILIAKKQGEECVEFFRLSAGEYPSFTPVISNWSPTVLSRLGNCNSLTLETYGDLALVTDENSVNPVLNVYSIKTGRLIKSIGGFSANPSTMLFSKDGEHFLVGGDEKIVTEWKTKTLAYTQCGFEVHQENYRIVHYSYEKRIAVISFSFGGYGVFDLSGRNKANFFRRSEAIPEVFITIFDNGAKLLSKSGKALCVYDIRSCELEATYQYHTDIISGCFANPDHRLLFSAQWTGSSEVAVWDFKNKKVVSILLGHTSEVKAISMNFKRTKIITGEKKGIIRIWNARTHKCIETMELQREILSFTHVQKNGRFYAITPASKSILIEL